MISLIARTCQSSTTSGHIVSLLRIPVLMMCSLKSPSSLPVGTISETTGEDERFPTVGPRNRGGLRRCERQLVYQRALVVPGSTTTCSLCLRSSTIRAVVFQLIGPVIVRQGQSHESRGTVKASVGDALRSTNVDRWRLERGWMKVRLCARRTFARRADQVQDPRVRAPYGQMREKRGVVVISD